jgi:hypothetical protein
VAAFNDAGESMPSEVLAVRWPAAGRTDVLVVNGFTQVGRWQNTVQTIPLGAMQRPITRRGNSFDFIIQHGIALEAAGLTFDSCANESIISGTVSLMDYDRVVWMLGQESGADVVFTTVEQSLVTAYLAAGGNLFLSGTSIGRELVLLGGGQSFFEDTLGGLYVGSNPETLVAMGWGGILSDVGTFDFDPANGAAYRVADPDVIDAQPGGLALLKYGGRGTRIAGYQFQAPNYRVVMLGFPFETISSGPVRLDIMQRVMDYLALQPPDFDRDGDVDADDLAAFHACLSGAAVPHDDTPACRAADFDGDGDVDLDDFGVFQRCFSGEGEPFDPSCLD